MIYKLDKKDYHKIRTILRTPDQINDLTLNAIISGTNRGNIYVDNLEYPRTALVDVVGISSIFIGDVYNEEFTSCLREFIDNQLKIDTYESCGGTYFITVINDKSWERALEEVISHRKYETDYEYYYKFDPERFNLLKRSYKPLPNGYQIKRINSEIINNDPDKIISKVLGEFWYSIDDFLKFGFGYCIMKGNRLISTCLSCCVNKNEHEINVETYYEEEMNKGLATWACVAYLEHCIKNVIIPHWSTLETNVESISLGEKLGFKFESKLKTLEFEF
ncbi:GNAT acetyltransferase [Gottschalkia purinilytica]|uniref:GNAT acetyltransferase n=1 Tax=Gottschalkia purinilytica TaxID=1503 RepID=A0A0L0WC28_GOTPU|nr:GNAT family N-acetyltransferase [Gottschalkia purinilytica]KNF09033.1 GNAT acetyltransferase [Gottschalkia purinilytica]